VIRRDFAKINASIPGLAVKERVPVPGLAVEPLEYEHLLAAESAEPPRKTWPVVVAGVLHEIAIATLLDGIEPKAQRVKRAKERAERPGMVVMGDAIFGDKTMKDSHDIHARDIINSQVGQTLTNCTNMIQQQAPGERKDLLETLRREVGELISKLPEDKKEEAAGNLELMVKAATSAKPNRAWYSVSAEGLLEASKFVKDFSGNIAGTLGSLGKALGPDFRLP